VLFAKRKSDVEQLYQAWKLEVQAFFKTEIDTILFGEGWTRFFITDGGGKYMGKEFEAKLKAEGTFHQTTAPDTLESNRLGERANQTLVTKSIAMLTASGLPKSFWKYAMAMATHLIAHSPASGIKGEVPYTKLTDRPVDPSLFRPFGCPAYALVHKSHRKGKFDERAVKSVLIGYPPDKKAYLLMDVKTKRIFTSRHVKFDEQGMAPESMRTDYSNEPTSQWEALFRGEESQHDGEAEQEHSPVTSSTGGGGYLDVDEEPVIIRAVGAELDPMEQVQDKQTASAPATLPKPPLPHATPSRIPKWTVVVKKETGPRQAPVPAPRPPAPPRAVQKVGAPATRVAGMHRSGCPHVTANRNTDYERKIEKERQQKDKCKLERQAKDLNKQEAEPEPKNPAQSKPNVTLEEYGEDDDNIHFAGLANTGPLNDNLPASLTEALNGPDGSKWREALQEELTNLKTNNVYKEVPILEGVTPFTSKGVMCLKFDAVGNVT